MIEKVDKKVHLIAQEIKLAKMLAGNDKVIRERAVKRLRKWFQNRPVNIVYTESDFLRIWKGLFYSMWMSDKPLVQEECAESISQLIHFNDIKDSLMFFKCGLETLVDEWSGIDQLRLNKFLMLVRRFVRQGLFVLKKASWKKDVVINFCDILTQTVFNQTKTVTLGLTLHVIEVFMEELAKVANGELHPSVVTNIMKPFVILSATAKDYRIPSHIRKFVFRYLIQQSDLGLEYEDRFTAWSKEGFPGGKIDAMQKVVVSNDEVDEEEMMSEDENEDRPLDPRAGRVNVDLPQIKFSPQAIATLIQNERFTPGSNSKTRKILAKSAQEFTSLAKGVYPLGVKEVAIIKRDSEGKKTNLKQSVNRLIKFENQIFKKPHKKSNNEAIDTKKDSKTNGFATNIENKRRDNSLKKSNEGVDPEILEVAKNRKRKHKDFAANKGMDEVFYADDLKAPAKKARKCESIDYDHKFDRNSGTWYVFKDDTIPKKQKMRSDNWKTSLNNGTHTFTNKSDSAETDWSIPSLKLNENFVIQRKNLKSASKQKLVFNPFSKAKKVKIALTLNQSQELHEHHKQVKNSPTIPFDVNKKPTKSLLKTMAGSSPINPFHKFT